MRILVHSYVPVCPFYDGAGHGLFHLTSFLTDRHECDLIQERWSWESGQKDLTPPGYDVGWLQSKYRKIWNIKHEPRERLEYGWVWRSKELESLLDIVLTQGEYDVIWSNNDTLPVYLRSKRWHLPPILINPGDSMHLQYLREIRRTRSIQRLARMSLKWLLYSIYQLRVLNRFPNWTMVAEKDARSMKLLSPHCHIRVIPVGVDYDLFRPNAANRDSKAVVFLGTLGSGSQNELSIRWFLRRVWSEVVRLVPSAHFTIVGRGPSTALREDAKRYPNVTITGYVQDPQTYLWQSAIFALPMISGAGIKNKLLEAWASGCAVVSTPLGIEGAQFADPGVNIVVAERPSELVGSIVTLLFNPGEQNRLSTAGQATVEKHYGWGSAFRELESYLEEIVTDNPVVS